MITDLSNDDNRGLNSGLFYALMMGGSAIVGNTVTLNFAPPPQSGSASGGGDDSQAAAVHKYFLVLCVPVLVGIGCLSLLPDLPKPSEQLSVPERVGRTLSVMGSKNMLLMAPYCFHIGVAITFTVFFNSIILDNQAIALIGWYNCVGCFVALPIGWLSDVIGRRPIALLAMVLDLVAYYLATLAARPENQPSYIPGDLITSLSPSHCGYACFVGLLDGGALSLYQVLQAATISTLYAPASSPFGTC